MLEERKGILHYVKFCEKVKAYFTSLYMDAEVVIERRENGDVLLIKQHQFSDITPPTIPISSLYKRYMFGTAYLTILDDMERSYEMLLNMKIKKRC